jgi:hypothetical protein
MSVGVSTGSVAGPVRWCPVPTGLVVMMVAVAVCTSTWMAFGRVDRAAAAGTTTASRIPAVDRPPPDPDPSSPGTVVPSGEDQSDPFLTVFDGRYFLYTSGVPGLPPVNVPVATATDMATWSRVTDALPVLPRWAVPGYTWAPDVDRFGSGYVLYFTAMEVGTRPARECIGDATGTDPWGPFTAATRPFICQGPLGGSIDPRVFTGAGGRRWLLWKSDQNIGGSSRPTQMWSQALTADGLGLVGRAVAILQPDEPWQGSIVEAPDLVEVGGAYWVVYSGNWFNQPAYAIGAARCRGPQGPCADVSPVPLLASNAQGQGPGEASVLADRSGVWLLYSPVRSHVAVPVYPPRPVFVTRLGFTPDRVYLAAGGPPPDLDPFLVGPPPLS